MARKPKIGIEYFPHMVTSGKTIFMLESRFGNDGYAFWFKLLEILGAQNGLSYDCNDKSNWIFLTAKCRVSEEIAAGILQLLVDLGAIDGDLWDDKIIWVQNLCDNVKDVFSKRGTEIPLKPCFCDRNDRSSVIPVTEVTQSKVKESKVKESKRSKYPWQDILNYLNEKTGKAFKPVKSNQTTICARFADGYTRADFFRVIDFKISEWSNDPKMAQYLQPSTLFGTKFDGYLNASPIPKGIPSGPDPKEEYCPQCNYPRLNQSECDNCAGEDGWYSFRERKFISRNS